MPESPKVFQKQDSDEDKINEVIRKLDRPEQIHSFNFYDLRGPVRKLYQATREFKSEVRQRED